MVGKSAYPVYNLAGQPVIFNHPVAALKPFATGETASYQFPSWIRETALEGSKSGSIANHDTRRFLAQRGLIREPAVDGMGWIGNRLGTVSVWRTGDGDALEIHGIGWFWTAADGGAVGPLSWEDQVEPAIKTEALVGPPLVLGLIRRGIWCLHASAVAYKGRLAAFLGGSGSGKSTLARYFSEQDEVRYVLDDILPVGNQPHALAAYPHFPQLKLPLSRQPAGRIPQKMPVAAFYLLHQDPEISIQEMKPSQSLLTLAGNTVVARLLDRHLLGRHLEFCKTAVESIPIYRLSYPHLLDQIPQVRAALLAHFEQIGF